MSLPPKNLILFGPPGTGKTRQMLNWATQHFQSQEQTKTELSDDEIEATPFWEILARALQNKPPLSVSQILEAPIVKRKLSTSSAKNISAKMWGNLQAHTAKECENVKYNNRTDPLIFHKSEDSKWSIDKQQSEFVHELIGSEKQTKTEPTKRHDTVTFHQSFSYEDFIEGIRPKTEGGNISYEVEDGIFKRIVNRAINDPQNNYALFIDELNRANISKVFGELITLLEEDKRLGAPHQTKVTLPYSKERFGIPNNLWVIASMNTADRSIALLDAALRRRFAFQEILPNPNIITEQVGADGEVEDVSITKLFTILNERIEYLHGRDYTLGHSYFLKIESLTELRDRFTNQIIPLLQDYFYEDWERISLVLGASAQNKNAIIKSTLSKAATIFGTAFNQETGGEEEKRTYEISKDFKTTQDEDQLRTYFNAIMSEAE